MPKKREYTVSWTIDVDADSIEDAARQVHDKYFRQGNDATLFEVEPKVCPSAGVHIIDVADLEEE